MTHGIRMYCFDDECDPQYMRLYINIEKYIEGIDGYPSDEIWICMHDYSQASPKLFTFDFTMFFSS